MLSNAHTLTIDSPFAKAFVGHLSGLFRDLLVEYASRSDEDFAALCGTLREHEITVFIRELPRDDRNICIDFNDEDARRRARRELNRAPAPTHHRIDWSLSKRDVVEKLDETAAVLAYKWASNLLPFRAESVGPDSFYLDRSHLSRDANGMSRTEAESWLLQLDAATFRNCLFNLLRPHATPWNIARILRRSFYHTSIESTPAWAEFERNLDAIVERARVRMDEAIERVKARYS